MKASFCIKQDFKGRALQMALQGLMHAVSCVRVARFAAGLARINGTRYNLDNTNV
jgi:hypothetical protein